MALASHVEPGPARLWSAVERVMLSVERDASLAAALDCVVDAAGVDRAALLIFEPHAEVVLEARGACGNLEPQEWEELSRSVVRDARERDEAVLWDAFDGSGTAGSLADLGVLAAAAIPLRDPHRDAAGVLYVDVRQPGKCLADEHLAFLRVAASLLGSALNAARQVERATEAAVAARDSSLRDAPLPLADLVAPPSMAQAAAAVRVALGTDLNVLITGESGSGKTELALSMAKALGDGPVVRATLGMSDDLNTLTSELFGHERGAFSGAAGRRVGLVERANGGTLILDEVLNLPRSAQQLLLDFTQFGEYRPLGYDGAEPRRAKVRLLAATQGDLAAAVEAGTFRRDLYYRLAGVEIHVPALRERRADLPALAEALLRRRDPGRMWHLSMESRLALVGGTQKWEGNLRELQAVMERARHRALLRDPESLRIELADLGPAFARVATHEEKEVALASRAESPAGMPLEDAWARLAELRRQLMAHERRLLQRALEEEAGVVSRVARRLRIPRTTLVHRMTTLDVRGDGSPEPT